MEAKEYNRQFGVEVVHDKTESKCVPLEDETGLVGYVTDGEAESIIEQLRESGEYEEMSIH